MRWVTFNYRYRSLKPFPFSFFHFYFALDTDLFAFCNWFSFNRTHNILRTFFPNNQYIHFQIINQRFKYTFSAKQWTTQTILRLRFCLELTPRETFLFYTNSRKWLYVGTWEIASEFEQLRRCLVFTLHRKYTPLCEKDDTYNAASTLALYAPHEHSPRTGFC